MSLKRCGYPDRVIKKGSEVKCTTSQSNSANKGKTEPMVVLPYIKGLEGKLRRIFREGDMNTVFKPYTTIRKQMVAAKDKTEKMDKIRVIYHIKCDNGEMNYIRETERRDEERFPEHHCKCMVIQSPIAHHVHYNNHSISNQNCEIVDRESDTDHIENNLQTTILKEIQPNQWSWRIL